MNRARSSSEESKGQAEKRSRSQSPKPNADFMKKLVDGMGKEDRGREEKKHKKHKHKDRSRSREREKHKNRDRSRSKEKDRHREKERKKSTHGHDSSDDEDKNRRKHEEQKKKWKANDDASKGKVSGGQKDNGRSMDDFVVDDEDEKRRKMRKLIEQEEKAGSGKKAFPSQGTVSAHDNFEGPECPKCGQVCKDNSNLKNHLLSHYYQDFYRCTPDSKPYPCPSCGKESRDRITMIRHYAFSHNMLYELTDVTPEMLNGATIGSRGPSGPRTSKPKNNNPDMFKKREKEIVDSDSGDDDKKFKERMMQQLNGPPTDKNSVEVRTSFGKHKEHKHKKDKKDKKDKKHKDHKKEETEEERRIRKEKRRLEKENERSGRSSKDGPNPLSLMAKELTPDSSSPAPDGWSSTSDPRRRIAHAAPSRSPSPAPAPSPPEDLPPASTPHAAGQEDESDDDFGDLPTPVFAE